MDGCSQKVEVLISMARWSPVTYNVPPLGPAPFSILISDTGGQSKLAAHDRHSKVADDTELSAVADTKEEGMLPKGN